MSVDGDDEDTRGRGKSKKLDKEQSKQIKASLSPELAELRRRLGLPIQSQSIVPDKQPPNSADRNRDALLLSQCPEAISLGKHLLTHERALKSGAEMEEDESEEPTPMEALMVAQRYFSLCDINDLRISDIYALLQDYKRLTESNAGSDFIVNQDEHLTSKGK